MKNLTSCLILSLLFWGCAQMEPEDLPGSGEVRFKAVTLSSFSGNMPHGRIEAASTWKHIFHDQARLEVTNKNTGQVYGVDYNPNEFGEGFALSLPYGSYTYTSEVEGGKFRRYLPFRIEGEFILNVESLDLTLNATTDYGLITVKNEFVSSLKIGHGTDSYGMGLLEDGSHYFIYVRNGLDPLLEINEISGNPLISRQVVVQAYHHYHFFLRLAQNSGSANFFELALGPFEYIEEDIELGEADENTVTDFRDGQTYKTVQIGEQTWMAENLNFATEDSWCYDNDPANCTIYGRLYERNAALSACPNGWHLPSREEWEILVNYLGGLQVAGGKLKSTTEEWGHSEDQPNVGATNESGFTGLPGGRSLHLSIDREYLYIGSEGVWWSSTLFTRTHSDQKDRFQGVFYLTKFNSRAENRSPLLVEEHNLAFSCRCIKN